MEKSNKDVFLQAEKRTALDLLKDAMEIDANVPDLEFEVRKRLLSKERQTGVYFLLNNDKQLLYVGKSVNIEKRLLDHIGGKGGNSHRFIDAVDKIRIIPFEPMSVKELHELEKIFIRSLQPAFNGSCDGLAKSTQKSYGYHSLYFDLAEKHREGVTAQDLLEGWEALEYE